MQSSILYCGRVLTIVFYIRVTRPAIMAVASRLILRKLVVRSAFVKYATGKNQYCMMNRIDIMWESAVPHLQTRHWTVSTLHIPNFQILLKLVICRNDIFRGVIVVNAHPRPIKIRWCCLVTLIVGGPSLTKPSMTDGSWTNVRLYVHLLNTIQIRRNACIQRGTHTL